MSIDLKPFCAHEGYGRYSIEFPFRMGELVYATDGRICLRLPPDTPFTRPKDADEGFPPPDASKVGKWDHAELSDSDFISVAALGDIAEARIESCPDCNGLGFFIPCDCKQGCTKCEQSGIVATKDATHPDAFECENCHEGKIFPSEPVQVGENPISNRYLHLMLTLPNCRIYTKRTPPGNEWRSDKLNYGPVPFTFTGGYGYIMPMREPR